MSWADVQAATESADETPKAPSDPIIRPGDVVRHPKHGDCTVHRITNKPRFLHMARPNGKVIRLSLELVEFSFVGVEGRARIFTSALKN